MKTKLPPLLFAALLTASVGLSHAQTSMVPSAMSYQGFLTDALGDPVAPTTPENRNVEFRIYDVVAGGAALWGEAQTVTVFKGSFSVILGNGTSVGAPSGPEAFASVFTNAASENLYFGITPEGDVEFAPRQKLLSSAFALRAKTAETVNALGQANGVPSQFNWLAANDLTVNGYSKISGDNPLEFGAGLTKAEGAGQIVYQGYSSGLDIVGAGETQDSRRLTLWAEGGTEFKGSIDFGTRHGQHINLYGTDDGIGVQGGVQYFRNGEGNFFFYRGGVHSDSGGDSGGGTTIAELRPGSFRMFNGGFIGDGSGLTNLNPNALPNNYNYLGINGNNTLEFGRGVTGKDASAGKIGYRTFSDGLDIVGAGTSSANRKVTIYAEGGTSMNGALSVGQRITAGTGIVVNNGSLAMGERLGQHLNLYGSDYGIGIQAATQYFRVGGDPSAGFAWFRGGTHANGQRDAGGGEMLASMNGTDFVMNGNVRANRFKFNQGRDWSITAGDDLDITLDGARRVYLPSGQGGGWITPSDERLKRDIAPLEEGLPTLMRLRPTTYRFKNEGDEQGRSLGFIAQEVREVVPEVVFERDGTLGMNYTGLIPVTVAAVQEQQQQIETLSTENSELKKRLADLEAKFDVLIDQLPAAAAKSETIGGE